MSCKQMTMVTPIHLMLFGSRKVEAAGDVVRRLHCPLVLCGIRAYWCNQYTIVLVIKYSLYNFTLMIVLISIAKNCLLKASHGGEHMQGVSSFSGKSLKN